MKIGIDASRYGHETATGVEWYSFYIINGLVSKILSESSHQIILYSNKNIAFAEKERALLKKFPERIKVKVLNAKRFWTLWALSRELKKNPIDLLFVPSHTLPLFLPKNSVIMIHDTAFKNLRSAYSFFQYHYLNFSTKFAVKKASHILVPSRSTYDDLIKFFNCDPEKISIVYHGYEAKNFSDKEISETLEKSEIFKKFALKKNSKYFFFVGRLEAKKNLKNLVRAFSMFSREYPEYRLVLAGKTGVKFEEIRDEILKNSLQDKIIMPGYISEKEKAVLFKFCTAFMFPSLYEGFGLPVLEAFAFKKPVICSRGTSLSEVAGDGALFVDPNDVKGLCDAMKKICTDDSLSSRLIGEGQNRLKNFSWEKAVQKTFEIINNLSHDK